MADGYAGKILILHLDTETSETIDTEPYKEWVGGHGMAAKLWWDYTPDHSITDGLDPNNANVIATSAIAGTPTPSGGGRCEMMGVGCQQYPTAWFTRSNIGGRFAPMMKYAGYDAIVILGKASHKVWVSVVNDHVQFLDAEDLWGLDTQETQEKLMPQMVDDFNKDGWNALDSSSRNAGFTTQRPVILCTGPNAENYAPLAAIVCDAAHVAGQGGFGGVWAGKNLKALGVLGSKTIEIGDPQGMIEARIWARGYSWGGHADNPTDYVGMLSAAAQPNYHTRMYAEGTSARPYGCVGCIRPCRGRTSTYYGNEAMCIGYRWFSSLDTAQHGVVTDNTTKAATLMNRMGMNSNSFMPITTWLSRLYERKLIGKGRQIESNLDFENMGTIEFAESLLWSIVNHEDIGADLALGLQPCAEKWGRWKQDSKTGLFPVVQYSIGHHYDPRTTPDWGYTSILSDRDINSHDLDYPCYWTPSQNALAGNEPELSAARLAEICGKKMLPFCDPEMVDYSDEGIYKVPAAKATAWLLYYNRSWKNSVGYCDWAWTDLVNPYGKDYEGMTPDGEPRFWNAATGRNDTFEDMIWFGKKAYDLDRAVWQLQGRTRDDEIFSDYVYDSPQDIKLKGSTFEIPYVLPCYDEKKKKWIYHDVSGRQLTRKGVEQIKTYFYEIDGCDVKHGWLKRSTLEAEGLGFVADELEAAGCLGEEDGREAVSASTFEKAFDAVEDDGTKSSSSAKGKKSA